MVIKIPEIIDSLCMVSDVHGNWDEIRYHIRHFKVKNTAFIFCGDVGIGFEKLSHYVNNIIPGLNKTLKKYNCYWYWVRGNHKYIILFAFIMIIAYICNIIIKKYCLWNLIVILLIGILI